MNGEPSAGAVRRPSTTSPVHAHGERLASTMPRHRTSLIGRDRDVAAIAKMLRQAEIPMLTLVGPGGVGKTRLAIAVAHTVEPDFRDSAAFISLEAVRDPTLVLPTIAAAFGLGDAGRASLADRLAERLHPLDLLLVVDNVEHVIEAAPELSHLLAACPSVKILATSRVALHLTGEHDVYINPLPIPAAVELFAMRARAASSSFALTVDTAAAVAAICERLDGLPLALEIAAARIPALPPTALLARLDQSLTLLTGGARDRPDRLRTMRHAISWSYDLLSPGEQDLFRRLSIFVGGFTMDAAAAIAIDPREIVNDIGSLIEKSILSLAGTTADQEPRYKMLETVREFGLEQMVRQGDASLTQQRHAAWFVTLAEMAAPELDRIHQAEWQDRLEGELPNLRLALTWATAHDLDTALRLGAALRQFWIVRGNLVEAHETLARMLSIDGGTASLRARALVGMSWVRFAQGEIGACAALAEEALGLARDTGDRTGVLDALIAIGFSHDHAGTDGTAENPVLRATAALAEALTLARELADTRSIAMATYGHAMLATVANDSHRATALFTEALDGYEACGDRRSVGWTLVNLGVIAARQSDTAQAVSRLGRALDLFASLRDRWSAAHVLAHVARLALPVALLPAAVQMLAAADMVHQLGGVSLSVTDYGGRVYLLEEARIALSGDDYAAAWLHGRSLTFDDAIAQAHLLMERIVAREARAAAPPTVPPFGLTQREREVLRMLASGLTDRKIADQLSVSPRTVSGHVANLLAKLDVPTRTAAASVAIRHGLD